MIDIGLIKDHLRISRTNTDQDAVLRTLEEAAVAYIEAETNRYFGEPESETFFVEGMGHNRLWLPSLIDTGETITVKERSVPGGTATTLTAGNSDGYLTDRPSSLVASHTELLVRREGYVWTCGYEYEVTGTRGFTGGSEPAQIRKLVLDIVVHWFKNRGPTPDKGQVAVPTVPIHAPAILKRWRRQAWVA